mmetsp:Transcript_29770/g.43317  ORF Transcript_29770/g.43317 Transcript_29770/m.43317 type:complete len:521 (-) Transcript_29770:2136-3698(-)
MNENNLSSSDDDRLAMEIADDIANIKKHNPQNIAHTSHWETPPNAGTLVGNLVDDDDDVAGAPVNAGRRGDIGMKQPLAHGAAAAARAAARGGVVVAAGGLHPANQGGNAQRRRMPQGHLGAGNHLHGNGGDRGQGGDGGHNGHPGALPRAVLHLPEWASPAVNAIGRSWKMSLLVVGCVGAVGIGSALVSTGNDNDAYVTTSALSVRGSGGQSLSTSGVVVPPAEGLQLNPTLASFGDFSPLDPKQETDVPFFWDVPQSGGKYMMEILSKCAGSVLAGNMPGYDETELTTLNTGSGPYVNVDTYTPEGILRAKNLNLVPNNIADVIVSPLPYQAAGLFDLTSKGRMMMLLQNPIDRIYKLYNHATGPHCAPNTEQCLSPSLTLKEYLEGGDRQEFNWMTKTLSGKPPNFQSSELTTNDLDIAKDFIQRKCIVGMLDNVGDAMLRFKIYNGWHYPNGVCQCVEKGLFWEWPRDSSTNLEDGSHAHEAILERNGFDMELYYYAKQVSQDQLDNYFNVNNGR